MGALGMARTLGNRVWRARWQAACAGTLLATGAVSAWSLYRACGEAPRPGGIQNGIPNVEVVKPAGSPVRVAWRARVSVGGAEFRVYRGPDIHHLQRVATLPADRGERDYRFRDQGPNARDEIYEVRFAEERGSEQVVARAFCARIASMDGSLPSTSAPQELTLAAAPMLMEPPSALFHAVAATALRTRPRPEPLDSPPRPLAA